MSDSGQETIDMTAEDRASLLEALLTLLPLDAVLCEEEEIPLSSTSPVETSPPPPLLGRADALSDPLQPDQRLHVPNAIVHETTELPRSCSPSCPARC